MQYSEAARKRRPGWTEQGVVQSEVLLGISIAGGLAMRNRHE